MVDPGVSAPIQKAVLTLAGPDQRALPLHSFVDRDGQPKSALRILLEEAQSAGVERMGLVIHPGDEEALERAAGELSARIQLIHQEEPRGYAQALLLARDFVGDAPFLHLVGDHLYVSRADRSCASQLVEVARSEECAVSAVQATREGRLCNYGAMGGKPVPRREGLFQVDQILEKPTPTLAEQHLSVPGLRAGHYLCLFGMHVLTPAVFEIIAAEDCPDLSTALSRLARRERYLAFEPRGRRYDIGLKYGLLQAQLALALEGADREEVLRGLVELFADREQGG